MKICPKCNQTYTDESLNYCLNDGAELTGSSVDNEPPPTIFMDPPRTTNPNFANYETPFGKTNQEIYQAPYSPPMAVNSSTDQTLPIISLFWVCFRLLPFAVTAALFRSELRQ